MLSVTDALIKDHIYLANLARLLLVSRRSISARIRVFRQLPGDRIVLRQMDLLQTGIIDTVAT